MPLFVEELTKTVLESVGAHGRAPSSSLAIPATLHDSLMARLDRLATAKEVAQLGATLGREFSFALLQAVSPLDETTLQKELARLSANIEAISHLTKGLELLETLPDTPERTQQELTLQIALGVPLRATKGLAAPEVGTTCYGCADERTSALSKQAFQLLHKRYPNSTWAKKTQYYY